MPALDVINAHPFTAELRDIIEHAPMPGLGSDPHCSETVNAIENWRKTSDQAGSLIECGLWLLAGELDRSHTISQNVDTKDGSFWHGIMHRREGDFGNSKYWFRRVGNGHAVHASLAEVVEKSQGEFAILPVSRLLDPTIIANQLVDMCQAAVSDQTAWQAELQNICWWEWQLLFSRAFADEPAA